MIDLARLLDAVIFNYLVGNNDAHGKNFSLVYRRATDDLEIRLSPLYDVVSTVYYPELSAEMAMRIGSEYSSDKVALKDFEQMAADAGLGKPLMRARLVETTERVMATLPSVATPNRVSEQIRNLIRQRCETAMNRFRRRL